MRINGRQIAKDLRASLKPRVDALLDIGLTPHLGVVLVGDDSASALYVRKKKEAAEALRIAVTIFPVTDTISKDDFEDLLVEIQQQHDLTGLLVQLPLPKGWYPDVLEYIEPDIDVDCLTHASLGRIVMGTNHILPPTPGAVLSILKHLEVDVRGKSVVLVGAGVLVGKPLMICLANKEATVHVCNAHTSNLAEITRQADILVSGVGKKHLITKDMVKPGAIVIDAGVDFEQGVMFGDVDVEGVESVASAVTPTPGGVGPITVARLLENVVRCAEVMVDETT
jgi:methylenetetrahydrofolate dehydrogenase (NADP+)/methenyltetrahydrofolate cyclohydrolase